MAERIVVTGIGCIGGLGIRNQEFTEGLLSGRTAIKPITAFDTSPYRSHCAATLAGFDAATLVDPAKLRRVDQLGRLVLSACRLALDDSRLTDAGAPLRDTVGVVLGSNSAGVRSTVEYLDNLTSRGPSGVSAMNFSNTVGNASASLCGIEYALRGPNVTLSNKEASGLAAIAFACGLVKQNRATAVVTGGADEIEELFYAIHDRFRVMSPTDGGEEASRPFDRRRNGFVLGEGGFLLVLEQMASATARGIPWYGEVLGVASTASLCRLNDWPADSSQLARCMRAALESAEVPASDVDVVFASANSTVKLDRLDAAALGEVFGRRGVPVVSIKGAVGEFGAAGAAATAAALLCLREGVIPPTVGCEELDTTLGVDVSPTARTLPFAAEGSLAMINSFASGGTNYSLVLRAARHVSQESRR